MCVFPVGWNNNNYKLQNIVSVIWKELKQTESIQYIWVLEPMNKEQMQV